MAIARKGIVFVALGIVYRLIDRRMVWGEGNHLHQRICRARWGASPCHCRQVRHKPRSDCRRLQSPRPQRARGHRRDRASLGAKNTRHHAHWRYLGRDYDKGGRFRFPALDQLRRKLRGSDDGDRQMVAILAAALGDGLPAVEAACAEALSQGVHSSSMILNILARKKDPGPAVTIITPEALHLKHAPAADCARYDSLRRVSSWNGRTFSP